MQIESGAVLRKGDAVAVLESMKTANQLVAARAGRITEVRTAVGETVTGGQVICVVEADGTEPSGE